MPEPNRWVRTAAQASSVGLLIFISTGLGLLIGSVLDGRFGTSPWLVFVFTLLGLASGIYEAAKILAKITRELDDR